MKDVTANMAGTVMQILVQAGEVVAAGQDVVVIESMKMEVPIATEQEGKVAAIKVNVGDFVNEGDSLLELE